MSIWTLLGAQVAETLAGHRANELVAAGSISADDARAYVTAAKMLADIEIRAMTAGAPKTADALRALDARLKVLEHKP